MTATASATPGALLCLLAVVPSVLAFAPSSVGSTHTAPHFHRHILPNTCPSRAPPPPTAKITSTSTTALGYAASPLPPTNDPYVLLGLSTREGSRLSGSGAAPYDEKEVKRAFRRMTKLYHPDAVTTKDSTEDERKKANDDFARINAAYQAILDPEVEEAPKVRAICVCGFGSMFCLLCLLLSTLFQCEFVSLSCCSSAFDLTQLNSSSSHICVQPDREGAEAVV